MTQQQTELTALMAGAQVYDLAQPMFRGMPQSPNHPPFQLALQRRHSADWYASWTSGRTESPGSSPAGPPADGQGVETSVPDSPEPAQDAAAPVPEAQAPEAPAPEAPAGGEAPAGAPGQDDARGEHPSGG